MAARHDLIALPVMSLFAPNLSQLRGQRTPPKITRRLESDATQKSKHSYRSRCAIKFGMKLRFCNHLTNNKSYFVVVFFFFFFRRKKRGTSSGTSQSNEWHVTNVAKLATFFLQSEISSRQRGMSHSKIGVLPNWQQRVGDWSYVS